MSTLKKGSVFSEAMRDFRLIQDDYQFLSFYETRPLKPIGLIVDKKSATLGLSGKREKQLGIDADHREICRFSSHIEDSYIQVEDNVVELAENAVLSYVSATPAPDSIPERSPFGNLLLERHFGEERRVETLQWLSRVQYLTHHKIISRERLEGTGKWLLDHILVEQWRGAPSSSLLWLHGIPGAGKTYLTSSVIDALSKTVQKHTSKTLNYFYCKNEEEDRNTSSSVFRAFVHQLLSTLPLKSNPIEEFYQKQKLKGFSHEAMDFEDSFQLYLTAIPNGSTTYIVIDALDECALQDRRELLAGIIRLLLLPQNWIRIFITSRNADDISFILSKYPNLGIRASDNRGDIAAFLDDEIDRRVREGRLLRGNINLEIRKRVKDHLIGKAHGMFLWVRLQLDQLCNSSTVGELLHTLDDLPDGLKETYRRIMARIQIQSGFKASLAENVLKFLAYSSEPVNALSLAKVATRAVGSKRVVPEEIEIGILLASCQNMVSLDPELGSLSLIHFTAREFLQEKFDFQSSHAWIASQCLLELLDVSAVQEINSHAHSLASLPDFIVYSAIYWPFHSRLGSRTNEYIALEERFIANRDARKLWMMLLKSREKSTLFNLQTLIGLQQAFPNGFDTLFLLACFFGLRPILTKLLTGPTITRNNGLSISSTEEVLPYISWLTPAATYKGNKNGWFKHFDPILDDCFVAGLLCAATQGHTDILRQLSTAIPIPARAIIKNHRAISFALKCCFYLGVAGSHIDVMKWVVDSLVNVPDGTEDGMPYSYMPGGTVAVAAFLGRPEAIEYFLKGIPWDKETKPKVRKSLLKDLAIVASKNARATALILEHVDVDVNGGVSNEDWSPILLAGVESDDASIMKLILNRPEIQVNTETAASGETALMAAAQRDFAVSAAALCKHRNININLRNNIGLSALDIAIREVSVDVLKVLLQQHNVLVNDRARWSETSFIRFGETPLIAATREKKFEAVKILLRDDRVNKNLVDMDGLTALDIAIRMDHNPLIKVLNGEWSLEDEEAEVDLEGKYMSSKCLIGYFSL